MTKQFKLIRGIAAILSTGNRRKMKCVPIKPTTYQFKLVRTINNAAPLCPSQLENCINKRGKNKSLVDITTLHDHKVKITYHGKPGTEKLPAEAVDVCSVLQSRLKPRAFSITLQNTYSSIVLIAKKSVKKTVNELCFLLETKLNEVKLLDSRLIFESARTSSQSSESIDGHLLRDITPDSLGLKKSSSGLQLPDSTQSIGEVDIPPDAIEHHHSSSDLQLPDSTQSIGEVDIPPDALEHHHSSSGLESHDSTQSIGEVDIPPDALEHHHSSSGLQSQQSISAHASMDILPCVLEHQEVSHSIVAYAPMDVPPDILPSNHNVHTRQLPQPNDTRVSLDITTSVPTIKTLSKELKTFQFKLVSTLTSDSPLSPPLLEERLRERGKKKLVVTVTLCNGHIKVQRMNHGKLGLQVIDSALTNVCCVLQTTGEARAVGFTVVNTDSSSLSRHTSLVLMTWKSCFPQFPNDADILNDILLDSIIRKPCLAINHDQHCHVDNVSSVSCVAPYQLDDNTCLTLSQTHSFSLSNSTSQQKDCLGKNLSSLLDSSFSNRYQSNLTLDFHQTFQFTNQEFLKEVALLQSMDMLVPLKSSDAHVSACSRSETFKYVALHVQDPSLDCLPCLCCYHVPRQSFRDLNDSSVPEHIRKGVSSDVVNFHPKFDMTHQEYSEKVLFSKSTKKAIIVAHSRNNGLQHLPTFPTQSFIKRMASLFKAYLEPKMYHERNLGVTNDPEKIARYLAADDCDSFEDILFYRDARLSEYWYNPPVSGSTPLFSS